jgi:hypothetical protein
MPDGGGVVTAGPSDRVYRAISRVSHEAGRYWPSLEVPVVPQRWNRENQPTIYASHEPHVAAAEKLGQLSRSPTLGSARSFWSSAPATDEVFILSFDPAVFRASLADLTGLPDIGDFLTPDYTASQELGSILLANRMTALRAPSAVFWPDVHLNEAYFVTLARQPQRGQFPPVQEHGSFKAGP